MSLARITETRQVRLICCRIGSLHLQTQHWNFIIKQGKASKQAPETSVRKNSLNFAVTRILFKIFRTNSNDIIQSCQLYFNFPDMIVLLTARKKKFSVSDNNLFMHFVQFNRINGYTTTDLISNVQYVQCTCKLFIYLCIFFTFLFCNCTIIVWLSAVLRWIKMYIKLELCAEMCVAIIEDFYDGRPERKICIYLKIATKTQRRVPF